jgi:flavorubredoxin
MATVAEIAEDTFRVNVELPGSRVTYSFFVIRDEEPALVETGFAATFDETLEAVRGILDPATLRHIVIPHLEGDESGALNRFLDVAPHAVPVCSPVGMLTLPDLAARPPRPVADADVIELGRHRLRFLTTPYVHQWDSMLAFDERTGTLFSSDLFIQPGAGPALTEEDRSEEMVALYTGIGFLPSRAHLDLALDKIERLAPRTLANHHGSVKGAHVPAYIRALRDLEITCVDWNPLLMAEPRPTGAG